MNRARLERLLKDAGGERGNPRGQPPRRDGGNQRPSGRGGGFTTAQAMGLRVSRLSDVGIAGIHRVLSAGDILQGADVVIVVAGMEGTLPSVVGGLVAVPVVAC